MMDAGVEVKTDFIRGAQGEKGEKGEKGDRGEKGEKGEKGEAFKYNDLTPEQIEELRQNIYEGMISSEELNTILTEMEKQNLVRDVTLDMIKEEVLSNNLFDGKLLTNKTRSTTSGSIGTMEGWSTTENILPVIGGKSIIVSIGGVIQNCRVLWYDANEAFISSASSGGQAVELPSTAKYFAFNISSASVTGNIMVNYGTEAMAYQPYVNALRPDTLERYAGSLDDINRTCILAGNPVTDYPTGAGNGWGYVSTFKYSNNSMLQIYYGTAILAIFLRVKQNGTWGNWRQTSGANISTGVEFKTGRVIGDKEEYGKRISFGALPNATTKNIAHGLSNVTIHNMECEFKSSSAQIVFNSYGVNPTNTKPLIAYVSSTNINIHCEGDSSAYTGYVTLYYTKNS